MKQLSRIAYRYCYANDGIENIQIDLYFNALLTALCKLRQKEVNIWAEMVEGGPVEQRARARERAMVQSREANSHILIDSQLDTGPRPSPSSPIVLTDSSEPLWVSQ